jgi:hypothetical protein
VANFRGTALCGTELSRTGVLGRVVMALLLASVMLASIQPAVRADVPGVRIDLRVLVVTDGQNETEAFRNALRSVGVPAQVVDLRDPARPRIDAQFLADDGAAPPRARFQAVVLPNPNPGLEAEELARLREFEQRFGIRRLHASVQAAPAVGLAEPGYIGQFDGASAQLTEEALRGDFSYARGRIPFRDETPDEPDSWVELASPLPGVRPLLTGDVPGGGGTGVLAGVLEQDGREELNLTFSYESNSVHFQVLAPGLIRWLTKGVHLGLERSYFAVHIDDVLLPNARWLPEHNCASGDDCPAGVPPAPLIRMTAEDVTFAVEWQRTHGFRLDLVFNGSGSLAAGPADPLTAALVAAKHEFGWINHTWSHAYLGCVRDESVQPWACAEIPLLGWKRYVPAGSIQEEIDKNVDFARRHGIPIDPTELVTGEHGGLRAPPQMEEDNPKLASALSASGIRTLAADSSIEQDQRSVGAALTVPRYTINLYYAAATYLEAADLFLWQNTTVADGGSGECTADAGCIAPVPAETVFDQVILPMETELALSHVLSGDSRPHYAHQSQLTEDRTIYRLLEQVLGTYRELFSDTRPLVVPTMTQSRDVLMQRARWNEALAGGQVTGWIEGGVVTVAVDAAEPLMVPLTLPPGTRAGGSDGAEFGEPYGGARSAWVRVEGEQRVAGA